MLKSFCRRPLSEALLLCLSLVFLDSAYAADKTFVMPQGERPAQSGEISKEDESAFLPRGNLFKSLLADPKELRFYLSYRPYQDGGPYLSENTQLFAASLGDSFGFYRYTNNTGGYSWQVGISGGIYAEFDINTSSFFLVQTDYVIGVTQRQTHRTGGSRSLWVWCGHVRAVG